MPIPYSIDLRIRVIKYLKDGYKQRDVASIFKVGLASVQRWWKLHKKNGDLSPKKPTSTRPRRVAYEKIIEYIDQNPDKTQDEIGSIFGIQDVWYVIKKMNYTYKKTVQLRGEKGRFEK